MSVPDKKKLDNLYDVYKKFEEKEKKVNWDLAIHLNSFDGLKPSTYLEKLINKYIDGKITIFQLECLLEDYYKTLGIIADKSEKECDIVSSRIIDLLDKNDFIFSVDTLNTIHRYLFNEIYDFAGMFRRCNLVKKEPIINNNSVVYADYKNIKNLLIYDFDLQKDKDITNFSIDKKAKHFAKFTSDIWQIHPFREGNTRTVTVFMIKYLRSLGYDIDNSIFKENSINFRNALVLSNYCDYKNKIKPNFEPLLEFYYSIISNNEKNIQKVKKLY